MWLLVRSPTLCGSPTVITKFGLAACSTTDARLDRAPHGARLSGLHRRRLSRPSRPIEALFLIVVNSMRVRRAGAGAVPRRGVTRVVRIGSCSLTGGTGGVSEVRMPGSPAAGAAAPRGPNGSSSTAVSCVGCATRRRGVIRAGLRDEVAVVVGDFKVAEADAGLFCFGCGGWLGRRLVGPRRLIHCEA